MFCFINQQCKQQWASRTERKPTARARKAAAGNLMYSQRKKKRESERKKPVMIDGMTQKRWALTNGSCCVVLYHEPLPTLAAYQMGAGCVKYQREVDSKSAEQAPRA